MKRKIVSLLFVVMLALSGCGKGDTTQPQENLLEDEDIKEPVEDDAEQEDLNDDADELQKDIEVYYIDETTGEITKKEVPVTGELSETIVEQLKETKVLSAECEVESVSVNNTEETIDLAVNTGFGDYIRGMGTTGSEQVLECFVRTYSEAYDCDGVKITENGNPFDTGHAVLDGYIRYE